LDIDPVRAFEVSNGEWQGKTDVGIAWG